MGRRFPVWQPVLAEDGRAAAIESPEHRRSLAAELPLLAAVALLVAFLVKTFVAQAFFIPSGSMIPTLQVNDRVVVSRLSYDLHEPRRGDIVVFEAPNSNPNGNGGPLPLRALRRFFETVGLAQPSTEDFIKRVIGLPGDVVEGRDGKVYVNGRELREPYLQGVVTGDFGPVTVPEGRLWVMGDNRSHSSDSRVFGPIPEERVVGRAILRIWPPSRIGFL